MDNKTKTETQKKKKKKQKKRKKEKKGDFARKPVPLKHANSGSRMKRKGTLNVPNRTFGFAISFAFSLY